MQLGTPFPKQTLLLLCASTFAVTLTYAQRRNDSTSFSDCATQMRTLENALYETGDNIFALNHAYYPASQRTSRFIRVHITFLDELGEKDVGCKVTYIWAVGGFLFFQPPLLFQYNSLFFNFPNNELNDVNLTLPYECRPLVLLNDSSECSCIRREERLEILTQQLNTYAMFPDRHQITRQHTFARATCAEELEDIYYSNQNPSFIFIIVCATLLIPIFTAFLLFAAIRRMDEGVVHSFTHSKSHGTVVAVVLTGGIVSIGILVCNVLSCIVVVNDQHEYVDYIQGRPINLYICFGTLVLNIIFILPTFAYILYIIIFYNGRRVFRKFCCNPACSLHPRLQKAVVFLIGHNTYNRITTLSKDSVVSIMFPLMIATPILCISTHFGYIMLAWLTEPSKCTSSFLLYYLLLLYLFFAFKRFYGMHSKIKVSIDYLNEPAAENGVGKTSQRNASQRGTHHDKSDSGQENSNTKDGTAAIELGDVKGGESSGTSSSNGEECVEEIYDVHKGVVSFGVVHRNHINTQTFCFLIFAGFAITGVAAMFVLIFLLLPFSSQELITYIFQLLQLVVVLVSTQIAYQILGSGSFNLQNIVKKFKDVYAEKGANEKLASIADQEHEELSDVIGEFAAEFTDVVIKNTAEE